jgi:hypothetical protein
VVVKLKPVDLGGGKAPAWRHWCPGCRCNHIIYIDPRSQPNGHHWTFDGNLEAPTFSPSIHIVGRCHYFIRAGLIEFCADSAHDLRGQTVPLPDLVGVGEDWD